MVEEDETIRYKMISDEDIGRCMMMMRRIRQTRGLFMFIAITLLRCISYSSGAIEKSPQNSQGTFHRCCYSSQSSKEVHQCVAHLNTLNQAAENCGSQHGRPFPTVKMEILPRKILHIQDLYRFIIDSIDICYQTVPVP